MRVLKKLMISICIAVIFIISIIPNSAEATLTDGQRQAIVKIASQIVEVTGEQNRALRYSQDHRSTGFNNMGKVRNHNKQTTKSDLTLTPSDAVRVQNALRADLEKKYAVALANDKNGEVRNKINAAVKVAGEKKGYAECRVLGADIYDTVAFDCSSLSSYLYKAAYGTSFLWCSGDFNAKGNSGNLFKKVSSAEIKPGDIVWHKGHVAVYLGDYKGDGNKYIIEASGFIQSGHQSEISKALADYLIENPTLINGHLAKDTSRRPIVQLPETCIKPATAQVTISRYSTSRFPEAYTYIGEVRAGTAIDVSGITTTNEGTNKGGVSVDDVNNTPIVIGGSTVSKAYWPDDYKIADEKLGNSEGYFHKGTPYYGGYSQFVTPLNWLVESAGDVLDWFVGYALMMLKVEIIGWTAILENVVSNALSVGTEDLNANGGTTGENNGALEGLLNGVADFAVGTIATDKKVTVEDIIFNNVPLLDVNFFDFSHAAGKQLSQNSPIYKIRELIAQWYYTLRIVAIVLMLVILLYNTVKAIYATGVSDSARDKAFAKEKIKDWLIGFLVVFSIHYFMVGAIWLNNQVVQVLKPTAGSTQDGVLPSAVSGIFSANRDNGSITQNSESSLYEQIRIQAYEMSATTGLTATFMYVAMVLYLFMFTAMYIKRLFILALLTVISPVVGALYAFDRKKYNLSTWGKEYLNNIIIQLIHAVVYTVLIAVALSVAQTSTVVGAILALILMGFVFTIEGIVKRIFSYNSKSLGGLSDSLTGQLAMFAVGHKSAKWLGKKTTTTTQFVRRTASRAVNSEYANRLKATKTYKGLYEGTIKAAASVPATSEYLVDKVNNWIDEVDQNNSQIPGGAVSGENLTYKDYQQKYYEKIKYKQYKPTAELEDKIKEKKKKISEARSAFKWSTIKVIANSVLATGAGAIGIPLILLNRQNGIALSVAGLKAFHGAFSRKTINGVTTPTAKFKGKKMLFFMASPVLAPAYANALNNAEAEKAALDKLVYKTNFGKEMEDLHQAKKIEADMVETMNELYADMPKEKGKLQSSLNLAEKRSLKSALNKTLTRVEREQVQQAVAEYIAEKGSEKLSLKDMRDIARKINRTLPDEVNVSTSFINNIRDEVRRQAKMKPQIEKLVKDEKGREKVVLKSQIDGKDIEKIVKEIAKEEKFDQDVTKKLIKELKKDRHFEIVLRTQDSERITNVIKDKLEQKVLDEKIRKEIEEKLQGRIDNEINEKTRREEQAVQKRMMKMRPDELVSLINSTLHKRGSLNVKLRNDRYKTLMEQVKQLDDINTEYKELTGEPIYKNVGRLVQNIRDGIIKE